MVVLFVWLTLSSILCVFYVYLLFKIDFKIATEEGWLNDWERINGIWVALFFNLVFLAIFLWIPFRYTDTFHGQMTISLSLSIWLLMRAVCIQNFNAYGIFRLTDSRFTLYTNMGNSRFVIIYLLRALCPPANTLHCNLELKSIETVNISTHQFFRITIFEPFLFLLLYDDTDCARFSPLLFAIYLFSAKYRTVKWQSRIVILYTTTTTVTTHWLRCALTLTDDAWRIQTRSFGCFNQCDIHLIYILFGN